LSKNGNETTWDVVVTMFFFLSFFPETVCELLLRFMSIWDYEKTETKRKKTMLSRNSSSVLLRIRKRKWKDHMHMWPVVFMFQFVPTCTVSVKSLFNSSYVHVKKSSLSFPNQNTRKHINHTVKNRDFWILAPFQNRNWIEFEWPSLASSRLVRCLVPLVEIKLENR
jgi:hypothetical protein